MYSCGGGGGNNFVGHWINVKETWPYRIELNISKSGDIYIVEQNGSFGASSEKFSAKLENGSLKMAQQMMGDVNYSKETDHIFFQGYELMRANGEFLSSEQKAAKEKAKQDSLAAVSAAQQAEKMAKAQALADAQALAYEQATKNNKGSSENNNISGNSFVGNWEIPSDSKGSSTCGSLSIETKGGNKYIVRYGWCADEVENGTASFANGILTGTVIDNQMHTTAKCEISFLNDKKSIALKTTWANQPLSVDYFRKSAPANESSNNKSNSKDEWVGEYCDNNMCQGRIKIELKSKQYQITYSPEEGNSPTCEGSISGNSLMFNYNGKSRFISHNEDSGCQSHHSLKISDDKYIYCKFN